MKKLIALILLLTMAANVVSCSMQVRAKDLMDGITPNEIAAAESLSEQNPAVTDFAVRLFRARKAERIRLSHRCRFFVRLL